MCLNGNDEKLFENVNGVLLQLKHDLPLLYLMLSFCAAMLFEHVNIIAIPAVACQSVVFRATQCFLLFN